jgi:hypothetical protein
MDLAERVVDDATAIGDSDLQRRRDLGLTDTDIMDVVLATAARCFFSKTLDALGVLPDASYGKWSQSCAPLLSSVGRSPRANRASRPPGRVARSEAKVLHSRPG